MLPLIYVAALALFSIPFISIVHNPALLHTSFSTFLDILSLGSTNGLQTLSGSSLKLALPSSQPPVAEDTVQDFAPTGEEFRFSGSVPMALAATLLATMFLVLASYFYTTTRLRRKERGSQLSSKRDEIAATPVSEVSIPENSYPSESILKQLPVHLTEESSSGAAILSSPPEPRLQVGTQYHEYPTIVLYPASEGSIKIPNDEFELSFLTFPGQDTTGLNPNAVDPPFDTSISIASLHRSPSESELDISVSPSQLILLLATLDTVPVSSGPCRSEIISWHLGLADGLETTSADLLCPSSSMNVRLPSPDKDDGDILFCEMSSTDSRTSTSALLLPQATQDSSDMSFCSVLPSPWSAEEISPLPSPTSAPRTQMASQGSDVVPATPASAEDCCADSALVGTSADSVSDMSPVCASASGSVWPDLLQQDATSHFGSLVLSQTINRSQDRLLQDVEADSPVATLSGVDSTSEQEDCMKVPSSDETEAYYAIPPPGRSIPRDVVSPNRQTLSPLIEVDTPAMSQDNEWDERSEQEDESEKENAALVFPSLLTHGTKEWRPGHERAATAPSLQVIPVNLLHASGSRAFSPISESKRSSPDGRAKAAEERHSESLALEALDIRRTNAAHYVSPEWRKRDRYVSNLEKEACEDDDRVMDAPASETTLVCDNDSQNEEVDDNLTFETSQPNYISTQHEPQPESTLQEPSETASSEDIRPQTPLLPESESSREWCSKYPSPPRYPQRCSVPLEGDSSLGSDEDCVGRYVDGRKDDEARDKSVADPKQDQSSVSDPKPDSRRPSGSGDWGWRHRGSTESLIAHRARRNTIRTAPSTPKYVAPHLRDPDTFSSNSPGSVSIERPPRGPDSGGRWRTEVTERFSWGGEGETSLGGGLVGAIREISENPWPKRCKSEPPPDKVEFPLRKKDMNSSGETSPSDNTSWQADEGKNKRKIGLSASIWAKVDGSNSSRVTCPSHEVSRQADEKNKGKGKDDAGNVGVGLSASRWANMDRSKQKPRGSGRPGRSRGRSVSNPNRGR